VGGLLGGSRWAVGRNELAGLACQKQLVVVDVDGHTLVGSARAHIGARIGARIVAHIGDNGGLEHTLAHRVGHMDGSMGQPLGNRELDASFEGPCKQGRRNGPCGIQQPVEGHVT